ncbi:ethanolamine ammonia-lyase [Elstera litoralis]|uniref:Ethanolamine ammonia-lyase small subunit n=1 Tax=Elstera litoralis TaxID=552518 RepID=A0A0F3IVU0_9PROT|nr:ethanolamine ammonia-lyase subunit EutC [Elstera litoralis]KJV10870.1 ethanolamine ammonia-lyase [Elstera litoralis]
MSFDPWETLRKSTRARIGLGRAGDGLPTAELLKFQLAHARARDAVHGKVDFDQLAADLAPLPVLKVKSRAPDRAIYLRRPDLGRRLHPESAAMLADVPPQPWDIVFVVADGLSAGAVQTHAAPMIRACLERLPGWRVAPIVLAEQSRVALGDEVGDLLGAQLCLLLVGERPGLSVPDSLGVYMTYRPKLGRRDSERNCLSNIHTDGMSYTIAADKAVWLAREAVRLRLTGVDLKENAPTEAVLARDIKTINQ